MTLAQLLGKLKKAKGKRSLREFATVLGISPNYLHYILKGERKPGSAVLDYMGLEERTTSVTVYVQK